MNEHNTLRPAPLESRRFGLNVYRGFLPEIDPRQILDSAIDDEIDVAIIRVPGNQQHRLHLLDRTGLPYLVADVLVYSECDLRKYEPNPLRNTDLEFEEIHGSGVPVLDELTERIFPSYRNHYSSNPVLACNLVEAYREWARSFVTDENSERRAWFINRGGQRIGFVTGSAEGEECETVLGGVIPEASGRGVYSDFIRFMQDHYKRAGLARMTVSTQVNNLAVQRVWSREGFVQKAAVLTIHVNSLMRHSVVDKHEQRITISPDDIERFGQQTGNLNRVHFDDDFARTLGFEERIAHEVLTNATVTRHLGTVFPGHGTLLTGYQYKFLKPVYPCRPYSLVLSFPWARPEKGIFRALVKVFGENRDLCFFGYSDLRRLP